MHITEKIQWRTALLFLVLWCLPLVASCQERTGNAKTIHVSWDPFLLVYIWSYPTIRIDTSENVAVQRIGVYGF